MALALSIYRNRLSGVRSLLVFKLMRAGEMDLLSPNEFRDFADFCGTTT